MKIFKLYQAAFGLVFISALAKTYAGNFIVNPVVVKLSPQSPIAALTVQNYGDQPTTIQLTVKKWQQQAGKDIYLNSQDVLATPPIFTIAPGKSQIIRLGQRHAFDPQSEYTYRLFLNEVPVPPKPDFSGLIVALRISIPVFCGQANPKTPNLAWKILHLADNRITLHIKNQGNTHIDLQEIKLKYKENLLAEFPDKVYILAGQTHDWSLDIHDQLPNNAQITLHTKINQGEETSSITLSG